MTTQTIKILLTTPLNQI